MVKTTFDVAKYGLGAIREYDRNVEAVAVGEQVRFSHVPCGDTRDRLYVKRVINERGVRGALSFCHNCGQGGGAYDSVSVGQSIVPTPPTPSAPEPKDAIPRDYVPNHPVALEYMKRYGFTEEGAKLFGVGWSDNYQRIVLPVQNGSGTAPHGCQLRRIGGTGPKYITMRPTAAPLECQWGNDPDGVVVVTEDLLSAWRVWEAGFNAVPLLGAHVRPERLAKMIHDGYKDWFIWLDNDKPEILDAARHISNLVRALGGTAALSGMSFEPKYCSVEQVTSDVLGRMAS